MTYTKGFQLDHPHVFLCPNCTWRAEGDDLNQLRREKDQHAMYECPLPAATQSRNSAEKDQRFLKAV
jgi:hypothetical protein